MVSTLVALESKRWLPRQESWQKIWLIGLPIYVTVNTKPTRAVNEQAAAISHSQWCEDRHAAAEAWRVQLRLAALANSDQIAQMKANTIPIAQRQSCGGGAGPAERCGGTVPRARQWW
jgi:hypothetical protein